MGWVALAGPSHPLVWFLGLVLRGARRSGSRVGRNIPPHLEKQLVPKLERRGSVDAARRDPPRMPMRLADQSTSPALAELRSCLIAVAGWPGSPQAPGLARLPWAGHQ